MIRIPKTMAVGPLYTTEKPKQSMLKYLKRLLVKTLPDGWFAIDPHTITIRDEINQQWATHAATETIYLGRRKCRNTRLIHNIRDASKRFSDRKELKIVA